MAGKPKTRKPPGKAKAPKEDQKAQSERFVETARKLGVDESGQEFSRAIKKIIATKKNDGL
jgi:hypothetical protein